MPWIRYSFSYHCCQMDFCKCRMTFEEWYSLFSDQKIKIKNSCNFWSFSRHVAKQGSQSQVQYPIFRIGFWYHPINPAQFVLPFIIEVKECPIDDKQGSRRYLVTEKIFFSAGPAKGCWILARLTTPKKIRAFSTTKHVVHKGDCRHITKNMMAC